MDVCYEVANKEKCGIQFSIYGFKMLEKITRFDDIVGLIYRC